MFSALIKSVQNQPSQSVIKNDLLAGLTVGIIALPLSMALAIASGVAPQHGLYTAAIAGIVIALSGGSKVNISGPTAAFVVVLLPIVAQYGLGGLLISGFMAGLILILMGVCRLGRFIEIVPYPVTVGFTAGIGWVIATLQLKDFFGLTTGPMDGHYVNKFITIISSAPSFDIRELMIGAVTLGVLITWRRTGSKVPAHLIALIAGSLVAYVASVMIPDFSVATIGSRFEYNINGVIGHGIPPLAPSFNWPWQLPGADGAPIGLSFELVRQLLPSAIAIAVLGSIESLLCAVVADGMSGKKHNPNDELIGQGIGNLLVPLLGGIPATAAIARTAANIRSGGTTPLASVVHGVFIFLSILFLAPIIAYIPMASMAALLLMVAWNMSEAPHFIRIVKIAPRPDVVVLLICFALTVLFDMTIAVGVGMGLASALFIHRAVTRTKADMVSVGRSEELELPAEVALYEIDGPLFFGSAQKAVRRMIQIDTQVKVVVLDMAAVNMIDMSAIVAMESIVKVYTDNGICLVLSRLEPRMILKLRRAGLRKQRGRIEYARTLEAGIEKAKRMVNAH
jgi:SulP family sulfate permease